MSHDVKTFRAPSMAAALDLVRQELGEEAVILHTRQLDQRNRLPWRKRDQVEITASLDVNIREPLTRRPAASDIPPREPRNQESPAEAILRHLEAEAAETQFSSRTPTIRPTPPSGSHGPAAPGNRIAFEASTAFAEKLDTIQRMLEELSRSRPATPAEVPSDRLDLYTRLIDAGVEDEIARDLVTRLSETIRPHEQDDPAAAPTALTALIEQELRCGDPVLPTPGQRRVVALVGPTGVGKTTTIAKLAANFRLRENIRMGLVTVDTYRIAAVEQLRTYAEIIDLPMRVVTSPAEMRRAMDELVGLDLVLIDTAGRSPRDELQLQELKRLLAEADCDEVHLVLSMNSSIRTLEATARKFAAANATSLILTKLDEAAELGSLISLSRRIPLPISHVTTGQDVPHDIEPAHPGRLANLILGRDPIHSA